jgi:hypothetical protein
MVTFRVIVCIGTKLNKVVFGSWFVGACAANIIIDMVVLT